MKMFARCLVAFVLTSVPLGGMAQQNYTYVSVDRVVKLRILPGKTKEFYQAFAYAPKVFDALKEAGLIMGYSIYNSVNYEGSEKWDVLYVLQFKNMAALDTFSDQSEPIQAKVYGSPEKRAEMTRMRVESGEMVSSELIREVHLKPQ